MRQIGIGCRKEKEKRKLTFSEPSNIFYSVTCKSNRKKKKKDQYCKDINVETMAVEDFVKVEIIKF